MSSANRDSLSSSLSICIPFISSSYLIALARNSKTVEFKWREWAPLSPSWHQGNGFSFSPLSMMLAIDLSYIVFIMLRYIPSIPSFIRVFIMKGCWILLKAFSASIEMIEWFLYLLLLICCITFNDLCILNHPWISGMKLTWSWCMMFLYAVEFSLPLFYWGFLHLCSLKRFAYNSLFLSCPCPVLGWV
jgi:hypothetical protein